MSYVYMYITFSCICLYLLFECHASRCDVTGNIVVCVHTYFLNLRGVPIITK